MNDSTPSTIRVDAIRPNPWNRKRDVDEDFIQSIRDNGLIQPIVVRELADGDFQIIAGERRWKAAKKLGLEHIPAVIRAADDVEARALCLIENVMRANLAPLDEAKEVAVLLDLHKGDVAEVAALLGRSRYFIRNRATLATLNPALFDGLNYSVNEVRPLCLDFLAKLPTDIQKTIAEESPDAMRDYERLKGIAQCLTHSVEYAPWIKDELSNYAATNSCAKCHKRTGAQPDLFGKSDGVIGEKDSCLDRQCYAAKERAHVDGIIAHETLRNPEVVKVARDIPQELYDAAKAQRVQILDAVFRGDVETCRKTDAGAMRAVVWCGEGAGSALYVKAVAKPEDALTVEQRREAWVAEQVRKTIRAILNGVEDGDRETWVAAMNAINDGKGEEAVAILEKEAEVEIK